MVPDMWSQRVVDRATDTVLVMIDTGGTVRAVGKVMDSPKSTVHHDVVVKMPEINEELAKEGRAVLLRHKRNLSVVKPLRLFRFLALIDKKMVGVYVPSSDPNDAVREITASGIKIVEPSHVIEFPVCDKLRSDRHGNFFCGDGDEEGLVKCPLESDRCKQEGCPGECRYFWSLIAVPDNMDIVTISGGYRCRSLKKKVIDAYASGR